LQHKQSPIFATRSAVVTNTGAVSTTTHSTDKVAKPGILKRCLLFLMKVRQYYMQYFKLKVLSFLLVSAFFCLSLSPNCLGKSTQVTSANVKEWLYFEVKVNPGLKNATDQPLRLEHIEIPMELLGESIGLNLRKEIYESLVFEKDGKKFVRWIFILKILNLKKKS